MKKKPIYELESGSLEAHPATLMWNRLNQSKTAPKSIERLKELSRNKSLIYRINGIDKTMENLPQYEIELTKICKTLKWRSSYEKNISNQPTP